MSMHKMSPRWWSTASLSWSVRQALHCGAILSSSNSLIIANLAQLFMKASHCSAEHPRSTDGREATNRGSSATRGCVAAAESSSPGASGVRRRKMLPLSSSALTLLCRTSSTKDETGGRLAYERSIEGLASGSFEGSAEGSNWVSFGRSIWVICVGRRPGWHTPSPH